MAQRVQQGSADREPAEGPARHVWVAPANRSDGRRPGLLVEWQHTDEDE